MICVLGEPGDYINEYTVLYTDSNQEKTGIAKSSSSSPSDQFYPDNNSSNETNGTRAELGAISPRDTPKQSCLCDNSSSQASSPSLQIVTSRLKFVPNQPLFDENRVIIFVITPTYTRPTQLADMTRLAQTLQLVPDIFWIVVEDSHNMSK